MSALISGCRSSLAAFMTEGQRGAGKRVPVGAPEMSVGDFAASRPHHKEE